MAKAIRSPETAVNNWVNRTGAASSFYVSQVQAAAWKVYAASAQAEANYATGVQQAVANKSRQKAIEQSSDEVWKQGVATLGSSRFGQGVSAAQPKMQAVMQKLIPAMDGLRKSLPPRGVAGSQENITRMVNFITGLHKQKGQFKARGVPR